MKNVLVKAMKTLEKECRKYDECTGCPLFYEKSNVTEKEDKNECFFDLFLPDSFSNVYKGV